MNNRVANCQLEDILRGENYGVECDEWNDTNIHDIATDLLEANVLVDKQCELIKEMREALLKISQYPIAFVCEEARIIAREAWKKSMEVTE